MSKSSALRYLLPFRLGGPVNTADESCNLLIKLIKYIMNHYHVCKGDPGFARGLLLMMARFLKVIFLDPHPSLPPRLQANIDILT